VIPRLSFGAYAHTQFYKVQKILAPYYTEKLSLNMRYWVLGASTSTFFNVETHHVVMPNLAMDIVDLHPQEDRSNQVSPGLFYLEYTDLMAQFFVWPEWTQAYGALTAETVFDYFRFSMFWDKQSTNEQLQMQMIHSGQVVSNQSEELRYAGEYT